MTRDEQRIRRVEQAGTSGPMWNNVGSQYDARIPVPTHVQALTPVLNSTSRQNRITVLWTDATDPQVVGYNLWVQMPSGYRFQAHHTERAPAVWDMGTSESGTLVIFVQPVLRNGLALHLDRCPTACCPITP